MTPGRTAALIVGAAVCAATAQQAPAPTFRASAHLIVQAVTVRDKTGKPIPGLTAKEFVVTEDGRPQALAFVEYQPLDELPSRASVAAVEPAPIAPAPPPAVTSAMPGDARYRGKRLIVLYFDLYQMPFFDRMRTFEHAARYVSTRMTDADLVALTVFDGRGVRAVRAFTSDRASLGDAIQSLAASVADEHDSGVTIDTATAFGDDDDTFNVFATDRQLAALQTAVTDLAALPELKTLVYFGSGLRLNGTDNVAQMRATVNAAVRANVTLNPVDARGLTAAAPMGDATRASPGGLGMFSGAIAQAQTTRGQQSQDTLYALAKDTGGVATFDLNDLALGIERAAQAVTGYYLLGYYTTNTAADGKYRRVRVSLSAAIDADLSYRTGYYGEKVFAAFNRADKERQLAEALRLEDPITEIPIALAVNYFQISASEYFVPVSVRMPAEELTRSQKPGAPAVEIDVIGEIKDEHGVTYRNVRDLIRMPANLAARTIQYETGFTMLPGSYVIKLLARNAATGRIGTFQAPFTVPNLAREDRARVPISSVVLSSQRVPVDGALFTVKQKIAAGVANPLVFEGQAIVPAVGRSFSAARPIYVFLQAYAREAASAPPVAAYVTFIREGVKIFETEPLAVSEWDPVRKALAIRVTIPAGTLTPGEYACQVTVLEPGDARATFSRTPIVIR